MSTSIPPHVLHLTRTACLVESRAHLYSGYLAAVFKRRGPSWTEHVRFVATLTLQTLGLPVAPGRLSWISEVLHGVSRVVM